MGADDEPGWREAVEAEERRRRRHRAERSRPVEKDRARDADDGSRTPVRSGLRKNLAALLSEPRSVRRRLREGVVQVDAPRHGAYHAISWSRGSQGAAGVAGPGPRDQSQID